MPTARMLRMRVAGCGHGGEDAMNECTFCNPAEDRIFLHNRLALALWDAFPVARMHALVIPIRHAPD